MPGTLWMPSRQTLVVAALTAVWLLPATVVAQDVLGDTLRALEIRLMDAAASGDSATVGQLLSEDFKLTSADSDGPLLTRQQYMAGIATSSFLTVQEQRFVDMAVERVTDDVAVLRSEYLWRSTYRGRPWNSRFLMTDLWRREGTAWRLVSRHSSYAVAELPRIVAERYQ